MKKRSPGFGWAALGTAVGFGAAAQYLADPQQGRSRRRMLRDKLSSAWRQAEAEIGRGTRDMAHRVQGTAAELRGALTRQRADDDVVAGRVRAKLGRFVSHSSAIETEVRDGGVILTGPILAPELERCLSAIAAVPGVKRVENRLEIQSSPESVAGLQGRARPPGTRSELLQENWAPGPRLFAGAAGGLLAMYGATRKGSLRIALGLVGAASLARAVTNLPIRRLIGLGPGGLAVDFHKTLHVQVPVGEVFAYFCDFRNFPRFMSHVRQVTPGAGGRSRWVVEGPGGASFQWDAEVTQLRQNQELAWRTLPGADVAHRGSVRFAPTLDGGTRMQVRLSYEPPAGVLGHAIAALFRKDPKHEIDDDLLRFKSLLEFGKATGRSERITKEGLTAPPERPPVRS